MGKTTNLTNIINKITDLLKVIYNLLNAVYRGAKNIFFNFSTRKNEAFSLLALTAITTIPIYLLMGIYASGHVPFGFNEVFWYIDWFLWIPRSIVEVRIIFYILSTSTDDRQKNILLGCVDVVLISLMGIIFWPIVLSMQYQQVLKDVLPYPYILIAIWSLLVALNVPLMAGSLAIAYKIEPETQEDITKANLEELKETYNELLIVNEELGKEIETNGHNQREFGRALKGISLDDARMIAGRLYSGRISQVIAGFNE